MLHFDVVLRFRIPREEFPFHRAQSLVSFLVIFFELHVGWRSRSAENRDPVSDHVSLRKRTMAIGFGELMRIKVLTGGFPAAHQEEMVRPQ